MTPTQFDIVELFHVVDLGIQLWSGKKKLAPADLKLAHGSELPPNKLASLGNKRVMNPVALAPFAKLKRRAEREVLNIGTRFIGGYAVPKGRVGELMESLAVIKEEFMQEKEVFLAEYNRTVEDWIAAHPGWEDVIRRSVESEQRVRDQLQFNVRVFQVRPVEAHQAGLQEEVGGLAAQLRREIAQQVKLAWDSSYAGRVEVSQKALRPIRAALGKAQGLLFLDGGLGPIIESVAETLKGLPRSGAIGGRDFAALCGAIHILSGIPEAKDLQLQVVEDEVDEAADSAESFDATSAGREQRAPEAAAAALPAATNVTTRVAVEAPAEWF